jgi:hypothetical protein
LISYYETMQREPGFSNILALCEVFGATNLIPNLITSIYSRAAPRLFFLIIFIISIDYVLRGWYNSIRG